MAGRTRTLAIVAILAFFVVGLVLMSGAGGSGGDAAGPGNASAGELPQPSGYVNDFADVIPPNNERTMTALIDALERRTGAQIAVATFRSMEPYPTIEDFGIALADKWGVGAEGTDSGVILLVAIAERQVRIEVGYSLEGAIPDGRAGAILDDYVIPHLAENDYATGLTNGVVVLTDVIATEYDVETAQIVEDAEVALSPPAGRGSSSASGGSAGSGGAGLGNLFYFLFVLLFFGGRWFFFPLLFAGRRRMFYGGGFGTRGGGSSFGGFGSSGGFGGGGFGGGGASRGF